MRNRTEKEAIEYVLKHVRETEGWEIDIDRWMGGRRIRRAVKTCDFLAACPISSLLDQGAGSFLYVARNHRIPAATARKIARAADGLGYPRLRARILRAARLEDSPCDL